MIGEVYPAGQSWGAVFVTVGPPREKPRPSHDLSAFDTLVVEMKGDKGGEMVKIGIKTNEQPDDGSESQSLVSLEPGWQTYTFALADFRGTDAHRIYVPIEFVFAGASTPDDPCAKRALRTPPMIETDAEDIDAGGRGVPRRPDGERPEIRVNLVLGLRFLPHLTILILPLLFGACASVAHGPVAARTNCETATAAAWDAFNAGRYESAISSADLCIGSFRRVADTIQSDLDRSRAVIPVGAVSEYEKQKIFRNGTLNDVATCLYIKGYAAERLGKLQEARGTYRDASQYIYARTWDPHGWFWSPAEASSDRLGGLGHSTHTGLLQDAAASGDIAMLDTLIADGADVNERLPTDETTALYSAVYAQRIEAVKLLLVHHADPNVGKQGITPLSEAAGSGNTQIMTLLLDAGADVNGKSLLGLTALTRACAKCQLEAARLLVARGAELESGSGSIGTPLHSATQCADLAILRFLIQKGADVNATDINGNTARSVALFYGNSNAVQYLDSVELARRTAPEPTPTNPGRLDYAHDDLHFTFLVPAGWKKVEVGGFSPGAVVLMSPTLKQGSPTISITDTTSIPNGWTLDSHRDATDTLTAEHVADYASTDAEKETIDGCNAISWKATFMTPFGKLNSYHVTIHASRYIIDITLQAGAVDFPSALAPAKDIIRSIKFSSGR
jgi:hypothetical protein